MMLIFMIPVVGLAVDSGVLYLVRARLSMACDAAALSTARNLNIGLTLSDQMANAQARGLAFFSANFPTGTLGTTNIVPTLNIVQSGTSTILVTASAAGSAPLYFMRFFGSSTNIAGASGQAYRRDVNLMLVLDKSGSMSGTPCSDMIAAASTFVNLFVNGRDHLGLVTFSSGAVLDYPPSVNFKSGNVLTNAISAVTCGGWTNTAYAYEKAYAQLVSINQPLALNLIVFFTDGNPTAFTAIFPIKTQTDTRYGYSGGSCGYTSTCSIAKSTCTDDNGKTYGQSGWGTFQPKLATVVYGGYDAPFNPDANNSYFSSGFSGCTLLSQDFGQRRDFAYMPSTSSNGNSIYGYKPVTTFSSGAYSGYPRNDDADSVENIGYNLAVNAAATARNNSTLNVVTYTIGLGSNGGVDGDFLLRMSNDLASPTFDNTKSAGLYVFAPNSTDLNQAFARVASAVLRLSQ